MQLVAKERKINFRSFLWHSVFLALATNFMDVDTIIPAMLIKAGGNSIHLGILTAIMIGAAKLFQLLFASFITHKNYKKSYLLIGINLRILSLFGLVLLFFYANELDQSLIIGAIFLLITLFSISGAFATVSYTDILGKSILTSSRKRFFTLRQAIISVGILASAFVVKGILDKADYPFNYGYLFLIAASLLLIASLGFWNIREPESKVGPKKKFVEFFQSIPSEIAKNANLKYYLIIINSLGLGLSLMPFLIMLIKEGYQLTDEMVGNFLIFRVAGMITTSLLLYKFSSKREYKSILYTSLGIMSILPILSLFLVNYPSIYQYIFILSGIFVSTYKIAINGVLIEISNEENRSLYTGIAGAGNILNTIFPLIAGFLISKMGFVAVFITVSVLIAFSLIFVKKLDCRTNVEETISTIKT